ncbi:MAG: copper resistance protein CopC [Chloroflexi bacterium]|nr:copper resistance protein CopC [Chloroflexota bacterium]
MSFRLRTLGALLALVGALVAAATLALLSPTGASDYLIQEEPERGSTVAEAPHQLILTFDRPLAQVRGVHHVEVTDGAGHRVDDGHPRISTYSQRTLVVPIHAEGDGALEVHYRVRLLGEGESIDVASSYNFSIDHTLGPVQGDPSEVPASAKSSQALVLWTIAILIGIAVAGGLIYFLRMATGNSRSSLEPTNRSVFRD